MSKSLAREAGVLGTLEVPMGLGLLRLSTEGRPEEADAIGVIHFALDSGIRLLDTAESYSLNHKDTHYGEELVCKALQSWNGPKDKVQIITKVGMARPKGKWRPDGSKKAITKGVEGSLKALGVDRLFLVQLHVKDSRIPLEETLSTLAELQKKGLIQHLGLCNVGPLEVRQAQSHFEVVSVQNELSVLSQTSAKEGMLEMTRELGIPFLAHRPLGGYAKVDKLLKNRTLKPVVEARQETVHEIALRTLFEAGPNVIPLIGATKKESLQSSLRALSLEFSDTDREQLSKKFVFAASPESLELIKPRETPQDLPALSPGAGPAESAEVVLLTGIQGAGKSESVERYVQAGYARLNRDEMGGKLDDLVGHLDKLLEQGQSRVVLDNTYPTRISRMRLIDVAHRHGVPVRCVHIATNLEDARINVASRILGRYGKLLSPEEMKTLGKTDPNLPPPGAMQNYQNMFEAPSEDEGFQAVDQVEFVRRAEPNKTEKGLLLDVDGTLRVTLSGEKYPRTPEDIDLLPHRKAVLEKWIAEGYKLFFISNQSGVHSGKLSVEDADACFQKTIDLLGLPVEEVCYCPHSAFPVGCFCRKPMPGMAVYLSDKYQLAHQHLVMVGDMKSDAAFAEGLGIRYFDAEDFFSAEGVTPAASECK